MVRNKLLYIGILLFGVIIFKISGAAHEEVAKQEEKSQESPAAQKAMNMSPKSSGPVRYNRARLYPITEEDDEEGENLDVLSAVEHLALLDLHPVSTEDIQSVAKLTLSRKGEPATEEAIEKLVASIKEYLASD